MRNYGLPIKIAGRMVYNQITVERWPNGHTFTRVGGKRVDGWFARYTDGFEPPRYPVPAIVRTVTFDPVYGALVLTD